MDAMDELMEYLANKDMKFLKLAQSSGRAQGMIENLKNSTVRYMTTLSPDAVATPEFLREFKREMDAIINALEISR